ncbi:MAG: CDP-diglyceride synthetase [Candidatus Midichloriaceae bacterium]|jgi:CDP-diglyceride synthetase
MVNKNFKLSALAILFTWIIFYVIFDEIIIIAYSIFFFLMRFIANRFKSNLIKRIVTAIFLAMIISYALLKGQTAVNILLLIIYIFSIVEIIKITFINNDIKILSKVFYFIAGISYVSYAIFSLFYINKFIGAASKNYLLNFSANINLGFSEYIHMYILIFAPIFIFDICAYFVGSTVGGPKLLPSISPKKTWSGLIGGSIGTFMVMAMLSNVQFGLCAIILGLIGQVGDLLESHYKRKFNVKDSGNLLPGHGGILDRMDSVFSVSIFVYTLLQILR